MCKHKWDKSTGYLNLLMDKYIRQCTICGERQVYKKGSLFSGWFKIT